MIALDTSAVMAILLDEPAATACIAALDEADRVIVSAATVAELLIAAGRRSVDRQAATIIDALDIEVVPVTDAVARRVAAMYRQWGRGAHPASLTFGDCFAYDVAKTHDCPLLFVGDDFARTDLRPAL